MKYFLRACVLISCLTLVFLFSLPTQTIDIGLIVFLIATIIFGILALYRLRSQKIPSFRLPFLAAHFLSVFIFVLYLCATKNFLLQAKMPSLIHACGEFLISQNFVHGFLLTLTHGLLPILIFLGLIQSCKLPPRVKGNYYLHSSNLWFFYIFPLFIYVLIFVGFSGHLFFQVIQRSSSYAESLKDSLTFLAGSSILFSMGVTSFYIPGTLLYLTLSRQSTLKELMDLRTFVKITLFPLLLILPLSNSIFFLVSDFQIKWITIESLLFLMPFLYLPMAVLIGISLSLMRKKKRSGYLILIILTLMFTLLNFSLVSMVLGILVLYYASQELTELKPKS